MSKIQALKRDALPEASASPGILRHLAFKGDSYLVLRARSDPGTVSGWHYHGDHDVYGYLVSGVARLEGESGKDAITLNAGDFFHVPSHAVHREINPSTEQTNEFVLFLYGSGPLAVNVED